jgi:hypothetical protein
MSHKPKPEILWAVWYLSSRSGVVITVTRSGAGHPMSNVVRYLTRGTECYLLQSVHTDSGAHTVSFSNASCHFSCWLSGPVHEATYHHIVLLLRMRGGMPALPHGTAWFALGQLYVCFIWNWADMFFLLVNLTIVDSFKICE